MSQSVDRMIRRVRHQQSSQSNFCSFLFCSVRSVSRPEFLEWGSCVMVWVWAVAVLATAIAPARVSAQTTTAITSTATTHTSTTYPRCSGVADPYVFFSSSDHTLPHFHFCIDRSVSTWRCITHNRMGTVMEMEPHCLHAVGKRDGCSHSIV